MSVAVRNTPARLRRDRVGALAVTTLAASLLLALLPPPGAEAQSTSVQRSGRERILGDVARERLVISHASGGTARGDLITFPEDTGAMTLAPRLANGQIAGLQQFAPMARGEFTNRRAIAGINGGYFLPRPFGAPNGLHVQGGVLSAGQSVGGRGQVVEGRTQLGIRGDGRVVIDRVRTRLQLDLPDTSGSTPGPIHEIDRQTRDPASNQVRAGGEMLLFDDRFGTTVRVPANATLVTVDGLRVTSGGRTEGRVTQVRRPTSAGTFSVPSGDHLLLATGDQRPRLANVANGHRVGVTTTLTPEATPAGDWSALAGGLAGGQLLIRDGAIRPAREWSDPPGGPAYVSFGADHANPRRPRTAVGRTADGQVLLVTIDGRGPDNRNANWSVGASVAETAAVMFRLGAVDAVNLDGGGSTAMATRGTIVSRPSEPNRAHATGLFVYADAPPPARDLDRACPPGEVPAGGFTDTRGTTHVAAIDCLAWWEVTRGVGGNRFAPGGTVVRAQMATFLAQWLDDIAERGDGQPLPEVETSPFGDVPTGSTHDRNIARLAEAGVINGTSATTFAPGRSVTRAQTATFVRNALTYATGSDLAAARDYFLDDNGDTHEASINRLTRVNVIAGTGGLDFGPGRPVERGAMASLIMRASDLLVEQGTITPP